MNAMTHRVLVFDSGVGGLSICQHIRRQMPSLALHYLSDNAGFPYGEKTEAELLARASEVVLAAVKHIDPAIVIIACNSASTIALPTLRDALPIPVIGVVPAIKTAAAETRSGVFGLLATPGTVRRAYTAQLIEDFASEHTVLRIGSAELVRAIEAHLQGGAAPTALVEQIVERFARESRGNIDTVVLGCTHFPLVRPLFEAAAPDWSWIDSGPAIAARLGELLNTLPADGSIAPESQCWFTAGAILDSALPAALEQMGFSQPQLLAGLAASD